MKNKKNGFTLFEMLVVISIISILTALVSVSFSIAQKKARDARRMQDMSAVQKAAEQYYSLSNYIYPGGTAPTDWLTTTGNQQVLEMFPVDPKGGATGVGWSAYSYPTVAVGSTYCACALLENTSTGNSTNNKCTFSAGATRPYFCVKSQQ